jgi:hypothetical protein
MDPRRGQWFHRQLEFAANYSDWSHCWDELLTSYSVPAGAAYEEIVGVLKGRYGDHQLAAAYRAHLKAKIRLSVQLVTRV